MQASPRIATRDGEKTTPEEVGLEGLLLAHARQASMLADRLGVAEGVLLDIVESHQTEHPMMALELLSRFEKIRRSATSDLREAILTLSSLRSKTPAVQVAIVQQGDVTIRARGRVASSQPRRLQRG